jgi:heptosyltransferase-3
VASPLPKTFFRSVSDWCASPGVVARFFPPARPPRPLAWEACEQILIIKLDEIGDFVLATPFLRELRLNATHARITLVVKPAVLNLAATCPHVDHVLAYDGQTRGLSAWQLRRQWRAWRLARSLRSDCAVIPRWGEDAYNATCLAAYSRSRAIVAFSERATAAKREMNPGLDRLVSHVVEPSAPAHEVEHNLELIRAFGGTVESTALELWPNAADRAFARATLPDGTGYAAFAPGALDPLRRWPVERFAGLAAAVQQRWGWTPVLLGAAGDPVFPGAVNLLGRTTLRQATALLARCRVLVGNDSGLMHLAAAAGTRVLEISGFRAGGDPNHGNSPARFHPWGVSHRVVQPAPGASVLAISEVSLAAAQIACDELLSLP